MPLNEISLTKTDTQQLFDKFLTVNNYKTFQEGCGVYCLFHLRYKSYIPLYVGSSIKLKTRATRFFRSQNNYSGNEYINAIIKQVSNKKITVGIKLVDCQTYPDLLLWEKIYQEQLKPILNNSVVTHTSFNLDAINYFVKKSGLERGDYFDKYMDAHN